MEYKFNIYLIISFLAIGQGLFLLIFLVLKHFKNITYVLLSLILLVILFELIHSELVASRLILQFPYFLSTGHFFSYSIGPLIYLYIYYLIKGKSKFNWYQLVHFIPFIIYNINNLPKYLQANSQKLSFLNYYYRAIDSNPTYFAETRGFLDILKGFFIFDFHKIIYVIAAFYLFFKYKKRIKNQYSNLEKTNLKWMHNILYGYLIIWIMISVQRFHAFFDLDNSMVHNLESLSLSIHIYFIAYMAFSQKSELIVLPIKKSNSTPSKKVLDEILNKSNKIMEEEKLFLNPELSLSILAEKINEKEHTLSRAINENLNVNFFDYVNAYRIEEAKILLRSQSNKLYTVEHIGTLSGFSSKTTFYRAFKKQTGITPSKFQKS